MLTTSASTEPATLTAADQLCAELTPLLGKLLTENAWTFKGDGDDWRDAVAVLRFDRGRSIEVRYYTPTGGWSCRVCLPAGAGTPYLSDGHGLASRVAYAIAYVRRDHGGLAELERVEGEHRVEFDHEHGGDRHDGLE